MLMLVIAASMVLGLTLHLSSRLSMIRRVSVLKKSNVSSAVLIWQVLLACLMRHSIDIILLLPARLANFKVSIVITATGLPVQKRLLSSSLR